MAAGGQACRGGRRAAGRVRFGELTGDGRRDEQPCRTDVGWDGGCHGELAGGGTGAKSGGGAAATRGETAARSLLAGENVDLRSIRETRA